MKQATKIRSIIIVASVSIGVLLLGFWIITTSVAVECLDDGITNAKCSFFAFANKLLTILLAPFYLVAQFVEWFGSFIEVSDSMGQLLFFIIFVALLIFIGLGISHIYQKRKNSPK